jgi:CheY-like chemotaxis protein
MSGRAGTGVPVGLEPLAPASIARLVEERLPDPRRQRLSVKIAPDTPSPGGQRVETVQAIASLLKNAFDASDNAAPVCLSFARRGAMVRIEVQDRGVGLVADYATAIAAAREETPELALVDLRLTGESGLAVVRELKALDPEIQPPSLARVEWEHIQRVLSDCAGNVSQAARVLGIHRRSLQRKLGKRPVIR